jgi:hypothetical protein
MAQIEKFSIRLGVFLFLALTWPLTRLKRSWALALGALGGRLFLSF